MTPAIAHHSARPQHPRVRRPVSHPRAHRPVSLVSLAVTGSLGHRLAGLTDALNPPSRGDGLLMLLGALALGVLVLACSSLLRLLNRIAGMS